MVLLQSTSNIRPMTFATDVDSLLSVLADDVPNVILLYLDEDSHRNRKVQVTREQVSLSKTAWPNALCVVVVNDYRIRREVMSLGADIVFNEAVDPMILLETISSDAHSNKK